MAVVGTKAYAAGRDALYVLDVSDPMLPKTVGSAPLPGGLYSSFEELREVVRVEHHFEPQPANAEIYGVLYRAYKRLYHSLRGLYRDVNKVRFRQGRPPQKTP